MRRLLWGLFQVAVAAYIIYWTDTRMPDVAHRISLMSKSIIGLAIAFILTVILSGLYDLGLRLRGILAQRWTERQHARQPSRLR